jgi:hypothetical protein
MRLDSIRKTAHFLLLFILLSVPLSSQEKTQLLQDELRSFHLFGLTIGTEERILTENYQSDPESDHYETGLGGINYACLIGSRLGYYSDLYIQVPAAEKGKGFLLDYTGGVGWNIWHGKWGLLPGVGFHGGYSFFPEDVFAEKENTFYFSFGIGAGVKLLYRLENSLILFGGVSGNYDTLEFSSNPRYRDRKNAFDRTIDYKGSLGAGIEL